METIDINLKQPAKKTFKNAIWLSEISLGIALTQLFQFLRKYPI